MVELGGFGEGSLLDEPHCRGNVIMCWTGYHTGSGVWTVNTAGGLEHGALYAEFDDHLIEITGADVGRTQVEIIKW